MSLPDNVTADTSYTVRCTNETQGFSDITVTTSATYDGCLRLKQDADTVLIDRADVPGLIAALQALAGGAPATPVVVTPYPAYVIDGEGDRWTFDVAAGGYFCPAAGTNMHSLDKIRDDYGIRETA